MMCDQSEKVDFKTLAHFIAKLNQSKIHHVGYCGEDEAEIFDALTSDFSTEDFTVFYEDNQIVGALGFDVDHESKRIELLGPFVNHQEWNKVANALWERQLKSLENQESFIFYGFYNKDHLNAKNFIKDLGGKTTGEHLILHMDHFEHKGTSLNAEILQKDDFSAFRRLHDSIFPHTYYDEDVIVSKLNDQNRVYTIKDHGETAGYVYVEGNKQFKVGAIEYIGVAKEYRMKGYGKILLNQALTFLFDELNIDEVSICVEKENTAAIQLYLSVGFFVDHAMESSVLKL
ncbi:GNAT family N-acetyltransferase [Aureibacillus halotolerans]|uniref:Acetyltransferase (GNAT) family protein n=1 Tax=Aureibacillus halotolerans TaxID=1508390 RepID=A0A4V3D490_9BACI|nr:GNAT family N-acetyltransferase [Aureibacillus halotolerans]TDQ33725.1 acetyltransferase (GNAT) family protein [Aureibacillus halotolerans]